MMNSAPLHSPAKRMPLGEVGNQQVLHPHPRGPPRAVGRDCVSVPETSYFLGQENENITLNYVLHKAPVVLVAPQAPTFSDEGSVEHHQSEELHESENRNQLDPATAAQAPAPETTGEQSGGTRGTSLQAVQNLILSQKLLTQQGVPGSQWQGRAYFCKLCSAKFSHQNLLTLHVNDAHPVVKPYPCSQCSKSYMFPDGLESHFAMAHRNERPYPCNECNKVFSRREYLSTHARVHSGVRPYACHLCQKTFAWRDGLTVHMRTHTGEKPYVCISCLREFASSGTLRLHHMIHTESFPYPCDRCSRRFRRPSVLRYHQAALHSAGEQEQGEEEGQQEQGETLNDTAHVDEPVRSSTPGAGARSPSPSTLSSASSSPPSSPSASSSVSPPGSPQAPGSPQIQVSSTQYLTLGFKLE